MTDKLYTQSELDTLLQAANEAALREAIALIEEFDNLLADNFEEAKWFDVKGKIAALIPQPPALARHDEQNDQKWIDAFGAQDLEPRVTPRSLADWVFRDVEQQLAGLGKHDAELRAEFQDEIQALNEQIVQMRLTPGAKIA